MAIDAPKPLTIRLSAATWEELTALAGTVTEELKRAGRVTPRAEIVQADKPTLIITLQHSGAAAFDLAPPPARTMMH